ncbi:uncharacterized protein [Diadema setosum]|uniref:uncharacterized protein n=1 Tax=Diadema setosum TaxID=31175 RepID=UPI003B3AD7F2
MFGDRRVNSAPRILSRVRIQITQALTSVSPTRPNLTRAEKSGISSLREDNSIHTFKEYKDNASVMMDKDDYEIKVHIFLDTDTYKKLPRDPTPAFERRVNDKLLSLQWKDALSQTLCRDTFYQQTEEAAMGSKQSPIVANLSVENFEETALQTATLRPKVWLRYVDDTFVVWQHGTEEINNFLQHLISQHPYVKFTLEMENQAAIPFLDTKITRTAQGFLYSHGPISELPFTPPYVRVEFNQQGLG